MGSAALIDHFAFAQGWPQHVTGEVALALDLVGRGHDEAFSELSYFNTTGR